jgi:short-subunit dehydrogenase
MSEVALVTGASSGIGAEFAKQLSARGYELILVARRVERMDELSTQLAGSCHVLGCDLAHDAASLPQRVAELGLGVDVLVNNAGFGTHGRFTEIPPERDAEQVRLTARRLSR